MKLVVIGGGNMGLTYAKGIHQAGLLTEKISILETGDVFTQLVKTEPDFDIYDNAEDCIKNADILLIAVKPFHAKDVFESIKNYTTKNSLVILNSSIGMMPSDFAFRSTKINFLPISLIVAFTIAPSFRSLFLKSSFNRFSNSFVLLLVSRFVSNTIFFY